MTTRRPPPPPLSCSSAPSVSGDPSGMWGAAIVKVDSNPAGRCLTGAVAPGREPSEGEISHPQGLTVVPKGAGAFPFPDGTAGPIMLDMERPAVAGRPSTSTLDILIVDDDPLARRAIREA